MNEEYKPKHIAWYSDEDCAIVKVQMKAQWLVVTTRVQV